MRTGTALLLVIGLVSASAAFAQTRPNETDTQNVAEPVVTGPTASEPSPVVSAPAPAKPAAIDPVEIRKIKSRNDYVTLNFTNIEINALIKVMSELTRRNFILDERVAGKVTLMTPTKMTPDEAYQVFLSALEIKGFTAVEDGSVTRIIPAASARQSGLKVVQDGDTRGEGYVTKLIRMKLVNPQDIVRAITPLVSKDGTLIAYPNTNSIIITDSVHNIKKIESLITVMDSAAPEGKGKINVYYLKNANAEDISKLLSALVSRLPVPPAGGAGQQGGSSSILEGAVNISADKSTNSLIIVASPVDFELVKDVIQKLDIRRRQVYVEAAIIEMGLAKQRELGFEMQVPINQDSFNAGETIAVGGTNFGNIGGAVVNGPAAFASMNGLAVGAVRGTFKFKGVEFLSIGALLRAVQTDSDVNVLSTPNILTTDNQKAEIMVGQNVPFVTGQTQNATTGSGTFFNTIDRRDVGIKLSLTPQITSDDNVRLEVNQEISDLVASSSANATGYIINSRKASTTVVVKDRETMVIGGLIRDNVTSSESKVPLLGDIPLLGWLFKFKSTKVEKTNLMIFITPYIIKTAEESAELTRHKEGVLEDFRKEYRIDKKSVNPQSMPKRPDAHESVQQAPVSAGTGTAGQETFFPTPDAEPKMGGPSTTVSSAPSAIATPEAAR